LNIIEFPVEIFNSKKIVSFLL